MKTFKNIKDFFLDTINFLFAKQIIESFEGSIDNIEEEIAHVTLINSEGNDSFMKIPLEDLQKFRINCKTGVLFNFLLKQRGKWETLELSPILRSPMTGVELNQKIKYYEEKYKGYRSNIWFYFFSKTGTSFDIGKAPFKSC